MGSKNYDRTERSIFAKVYDDDIAIRQRRAGFFVLHQINPGAIDDVAEVWRRDGGQCEVFFQRVILPDGVDEWSAAIPDGILCVHGDGRHEAARSDSITVPWSEVKA